MNEDASVLVVGAPLHDGGVVDGGKVVVYEWDVGLQTWVPTLDVDGGFASGLFGWSVSASGDFVAASEPGGAFGFGDVVITRRTAPAPWVGDGFLAGSEFLGSYGFDVAIDVDATSGAMVLAVGAPLQDVLGVQDQGVVDVYERQGGAWPLREELTTFGTGLHAFSGWSVDVCDGQLLMGVPGSMDIPGGRALAYRWDGAHYGLTLSHWENQAGSRLGQSVALGSEYGLVGAPGNDPLGLGADTGRVSVFQRNPLGDWAGDGLFWTGGAPAAGAQFGFATALGDARALLGQPFASSGGLASAGRVCAVDLTSELVHTDLGSDLAGTAGQTPELTGVGGMCDKPIQWLAASKILPGASVWLVLGVGPDPLPFKGGVLVPRPDIVLPLGPSLPSGNVWLAFLVPTGLPAYSLWWQLWVVDPGGFAGFAATNALRADYPAY